MPRQVRRAALARLWRGVEYFSPTPRRPKRQNHPNLFLLGFRPKLMTIAYFQNTLPLSAEGKGLRPGPCSFVARVAAASKRKGFRGLEAGPGQGARGSGGPGGARGPGQVRGR